MNSAVPPPFRADLSYFSPSMSHCVRVPFIFFKKRSLLAVVESRKFFLCVPYFTPTSISFGFPLNCLQNPSDLIVQSFPVCIRNDHRPWSLIINHFKPIVRGFHGFDRSLLVRVFNIYCKIYKKNLDMGIIPIPWLICYYRPEILHSSIRF